MRHRMSKMSNKMTLNETNETQWRKTRQRNDKIWKTRHWEKWDSDIKLEKQDPKWHKLRKMRQITQNKTKKRQKTRQKSYIVTKKWTNEKKETKKLHKWHKQDQK